MNRAINCLLCVAILIGLVLFVRAQFSLNKLQSEHDRLTAKYGVLEILDHDKFYIKRLETVNEKDFLWRVYRPGGVNLKSQTVWGTGNRSGGSGSLNEGSEALFRCNIVSTDSGMNVHVMDGNGAGCSGMSDKVMADFLDEHWSELEIETIADGEYSMDQLLRFLTIRIPPALLAELGKRKGGQRYRGFDKPVFEHTVGTNVAYTKAEKQ